MKVSQYLPKPSLWKGLAPNYCIRLWSFLAMALKTRNLESPNPKTVYWRFVKAVLGRRLSSSCLQDFFILYVGSP